MNIIIVGCGKIGTTLLADLVAEGHNVTVVDKSSEIVADVTNIYDSIGVCGNGADYETLEEAGVAGAGLFIAVTDSDETNMLSCFLAKRMGAAHTIARIRNPEYNDSSLGFMRQQLGLDFSINPELLAAQELLNLLKLPAAAKTEYFSRRRLEMVELRLKQDSPLLGVPLWELRKKSQLSYLICCVQRGSAVQVPDGDFILQAEDRIGLIAAPAELQKLLKLFGLVQKQARSVMLLGGSKTAFYLAKMLAADGSSVKIIDQDRNRCETLSELLPRATIICGDGARQELLNEEGLPDMDAFVSLTGMDEENILVSFYAASRNVPKVISKVNRAELEDMAQRLGLDCVISPRRIVSDVLVRYARALENSEGSSMDMLYKLMDDRAEALEFTVGPDFQALQVPLKDMHLKKNVLLAGLLRGRRALIPSGEDVLQAGDKVVILATGHRLQVLSDIFE